MQGVPLKEWNYAISVLGVPGTGKSVYAMRVAWHLASKTPAYVVAHDPTGSYTNAKNLTYAGRPPVFRYESTQALWSQLSRRGAGIHVLDVSDGNEVISAGVQLAEASGARAKNGRAIPVIVLLDEAVAVAGASPYRLDDELRNLIARRRHIGSGVGIIWTSQSPQFAHYALLGLSTQITMFRLTDQKAFDRLERVGVPKEMLIRVRALPDYKSITYSPNMRITDKVAPLEGDSVPPHKGATDADLQERNIQSVSGHGGKPQGHPDGLPSSVRPERRPTGSESHHVQLRRPV